MAKSTTTRTAARAQSDFSNAKAFLRYGGKRAIEIDRWEDITIVLREEDYLTLAGAAYAVSPKDQEFPDCVALGIRSYQKQICLPVALDFPPASFYLEGRALICLCAVGNDSCVSITLRVQGTKDAPADFKWELAKDLSPFKRGATRQWSPSSNPHGFANSFATQANEILKTIPGSGFPQGLLVIAGSTGSGKSQIAKGLMMGLLDQRWEKRRRPHVVTIEDPIEKKYFFQSVADARVDPIDYTARQAGNAVPGKKQEYPTLLHAVSDAMRQTPAVFYAGEVRADKDWKHLLWLANTGHLVVTTTHASSVVDFFKKLSGCVKFKTPADRSEIASRMCAVIHLEGLAIVLKRTKEAIERRKKDANALKSKIDPAAPAEGISLPSIWRRTPRSISDLVADGLASITPHVLTAARPVANENVGCLGRGYFVQQFEPELSKEFIGDAIREISTKAVTFDLLGMQV